MARESEPQTTSQAVAEGGKDTPGYIPSPYEAVFDRVIQRRFATRLGEPVIDQQGRLVRRATPVTTGLGMTLHLQYARINPLENENAQTVLDLDYELTNGNPDVTPEELAEALRQRIVARDGAYDLHRALTDPNYLGNREVLVRWPETYDFAVFDEVGLVKLPGMVKKAGTVNGIRADIHARLTIPPLYRGYNHVPGFDQDTTLTVQFPSLDRRATRALEVGFSYRGDDPLPERAIKSLYLLNNRSPKQVMERVGHFVAVLLRP